MEGRRFGPTDVGLNPESWKQTGSERKSHYGWETTLPLWQQA